MGMSCCWQSQIEFMINELITTCFHEKQMFAIIKSSWDRTKNPESTNPELFYEKEFVYLHFCYESSTLSLTL